MGLKESVDIMRALINEMLRDLNKSDRGNKTAAQRVRTASIKFTKIAKQYRKESLERPKKNKKKRPLANKV